MPTTPNYGFPYPAGSETPNVPYHLQQLAQAIDSKFFSLESTIPESVPLASGWVADAAYPDGMRVRELGDGTALLECPIINRVGTSLAISAGVAYTVATLPVEFRPYILFNAACVAGVNSVLGPGRMHITPAGLVQYVHYFATGTMATGGGVGNSIALPTVRFRHA